MSDPQAYLWLIPALPLLGAVVTTLLGPRLLREQSHWPCVLATIAACVLSIMVAFSAPTAGDQVAGWQPYFTWFQAGDLDVPFKFRLDPLTSLFLLFVTFISSLIAIYSIGYMHSDPGYPRFFAEVALFIFSMTGLVLADNFILLYAFWEGVGLCSYLLIGFWFNKPSATAAARKAFLVTRIGDLGFFIGVVLLWYQFGGHLDYDTVLDPRAIADKFGHSPGVLTAICLLLFCGAVGKSAQFPLHVWLPDAMEGPTPVSALIHAATMVTAGVYMVARCMPLFRESEIALLTVACVGGLTALLAAFIALTQNDLKRVLAYSTVSQLGYMFLALGSGTTRELATVAVVAAMFHLVTHAVFKALLFMAAGSVMHAMGNVIDMRRFGGLRRLLPWTHGTFLMGALALAGVVPFAGFWSKDEILGTTFEAARHGHSFPTVYMILFAVGLVTAAMTAFYTFRAYFLTFWGEERVPEEAGHHAHESPAVMVGPLVILAVGAVTLGVILQPFTHWLSDFLLHMKWLEPVPHHEFDYVLMIGSTLAAGVGVGVAWWMYLRSAGLAGRVAARVPVLYQLSLNKVLFDDIYDILVVRPAAAFAYVCRLFDWHLLDGLVDLIAQVPRAFGIVFRPIQNGLVQFYALAMVAGLTVFVIALVRSLAG